MAENDDIIDEIKECNIFFLHHLPLPKKAPIDFVKELRDKQMILDSIPALIFVKDVENRLIAINKTFEEVTGLTPERVLGKKITEFIKDDNLAAEYWKNDLEVFTSGIPKRNIIENHITDKSKWFITDKIPLHSETGEIQGILSYSVDITERKYAEESLMRSEQRFKLFFNTSPDTIILSTPDGKFLSANPAFEALTGYNTDEIEDFTFQRITPPTWPCENEEIKMAETLVTEISTTLTIEKEYQRIDGTVVPVRVTGWIIRDEMQKPTQLCLYVKDLTYEKKADELEKSLLKKEKEQLSKDLEAKIRELSTKITQLIEKTELVENVVTQLEKIINKDSVSISSDLLTVIQYLKRNNSGNFWSQFEYTFGQINQSFYNNLFKTYPNLTNNEKKICAFLKMNLSTKDISTITHQSARSIEIARFRLRIKMNLHRNENLPKFLSQF